MIEITILIFFLVATAIFNLAISRPLETHIDYIPISIGMMFVVIMSLEKASLPIEFTFTLVLIYVALSVIAIIGLKNYKNDISNFSTYREYFLDPWMGFFFSLIVSTLLLYVTFLTSINIKGITELIIMDNPGVIFEILDLIRDSSLTFTISIILIINGLLLLIWRVVEDLKINAKI